ncbi:MAG: Na+-transporting NADH:ubiquinone oxidoreductase subunit A [Saprospiraceae bacterium]
MCRFSRAWYYYQNIFNKKISVLKNGITKLAFLIFFLSITLSVSAQSSTGDSSNYVVYALVAIAALILITVILQVSDNLLRVEAKQMGVDKGGADFSIFPRIGNLFSATPPEFVGNDPVTYLKKGHDILLEGEAAKTIDNEVQANTFSVQPQNFIGMSPIPKVLPEVGDTVKAGDTLFFDKKRPEIKYAAPVSGEVIEVRRGAKRAISDIVILKDKEIQYRAFDKFDLEEGSREDLVNYMLESGVWSFIRQRPYDILANPTDIPSNIFVSTFDTAPLAPDLNFVVAGKEVAFQKGLDILAKLTEGKVFLGLNAKGGNAPSVAFTNATGVERRWYNGAHPSGNVGIQIHHTAPVDGKNKAWILGVQEVISIGTLFNEGKYDASRLVAVTGSELSHPKYVQTYIGASISELLQGNVEGEGQRIISGDVLSGRQTNPAGFLNYFDDQITVIKEGDYYEMFGWLLPLAPRPSISKSFPNFLFKDYKFTPDTNTHGEKRAFVVTGQYEQVLPMDIFPQHLMKAILVNDFERMEGLGIYELSEEDVALCEFVCTSKQPLQAILREGLDAMIDQG